MCRTTHLLTVLLGAGLLFASSSCATRPSGYKITQETIEFVQPGTTTKAEVIENLGPPLFELQPERVLAYSWGKMRSTGAKPASANQDPSMAGRPMRYAVEPGGIDETGVVESQRWIFCIAFDANDRVQRVERLKVEKEGASLEQTARHWVQGAR